MGLAIVRRPEQFLVASVRSGRRAGLAGGKLPLALFATQLALNSLWSVLFFGLQQPGVAAVEIVLLWAAILATLVAFWKQLPWAGGLLVPYLVWVGLCGRAESGDLAANERLSIAANRRTS